MFRGKAITEKAEGGNVSVVNISNISDIGIDYANLETINEEARKVARYLRDVLITTKLFSIMWVSSQVAFYDCWVVVPYVVLWQFALVLFCGAEYEIYDKGLLKNGITAVFLIWQYVDDYVFRPFYAFRARYAWFV